MPRRRTLSRFRRQDFRKLTLAQTTELLSGWLPRGDSAFDHDLESFRMAWEEHRDRLLPDYIKRNPGRRPGAWWILECGEERPIVDGADLEALARAREEYTRYGYFLGSSYLQPEWEFLRDRGLLEPGERAEIERKLAGALPAVT